MRIISLLLIISTFSFSVFSQSTKAAQKRALDTYLDEQAITNGGLKIKRDFFDITISKLRKKYYGLIDRAETLEEFNGYWKKTKRSVLPEEEFEQLLIGLTAEFQDGHHNTMRKSTAHWDLGLKTAVIQGKLYVTGFNRKIFNTGNFSQTLKIGDEIISLNGQSVQDLKKEFLLYTRMFSGTYEAQEIMAMESMVSRSGRYLRSVEEGESVILGINRAGQKIEGELTWVDASKLSQDIMFYAGLDPSAPRNFTAPKYRYGMMSQRGSQFRQGIESLKLGDGAIVEIGDLINNDFLKELRKVPEKYHPQVTVSPVTRLQAYTVNFNGMQAGVIRIPSYSPSGGFLEVIREFNWIAEAITRINIMGVKFYAIDANSNGGGYVAYVSHLLRFFAYSQDIKTGSANIKLTKAYLQMLKQASIKGVEMELLADFGEDVLSKLEDIVNPALIKDELVEGRVNLKDYFSVVKENFADKHQIKQLYDRLQKKYDAGERWSGQLPYMGTANGITENTSGRSARIANPVFEKPVIFLNDVRSASGGDYAPAILIDNGNAIVMGDTSRGLGMPVFRSQDSLPGSEVYTRNPYAFSLLSSGLPLENVGPVPHIRREIFHFDLMSGFSKYASDVLSVGVNLARGVDYRKIQPVINKGLAKIISGGKIPVGLTKIFSLRTKLESKLAEIAKKSTKANLLTEEIAGELGFAYSNFYVDVTDVLKAEIKISVNRYHKIQQLSSLIKIPLPNELMTEDPMLASSFRGRSVLDRTNQLLSHSRFAKRPHAKGLLRLIHASYSLFENPFTGNDCDTPYLVLNKANPNSFKTK